MPRAIIADVHHDLVLKSIKQLARQSTMTVPVPDYAWGASICAQ
ncbi:hypothetical protein CHELA1G11_13862 [Hyphomicrobiales bacterium]|nr:hypothetical protein CHELA1G2_10452 [Hyphomicrobiales bacterium]CAH1674558.1 hypothetical protein CHELA1G11_13862 [Hyphomicrobiales bacterium]